ncbi:response regulator [Nisaea sp.]|uniref:response regulator n=1 Tax=Nisaea sp. TaxID=2024842 RepID=UPI003B51E83D
MDGMVMEQNTLQKEVTILIVDDDSIDRMAFIRSLRKAKVANPYVEAHDGAEALDILRGNNGHARLTGPCIILLDWNMPRLGGEAFLEALRADPDLGMHVVFVLTTSDSDEDRLAAYRKHVAGYIVKSRAAEGFLDAVTMLDRYWRVVELP